MKLGHFNKAIVVYLNISPLHKDTITSNKDLCTATGIFCLCASSTLCDFWLTRRKTTTDTREKWVTSLVLALEQWFAVWNTDSSQRQKNSKTSAWPAIRNVNLVLDPNKPNGWHVWVRIRTFPCLPMFHFHCFAISTTMKSELFIHSCLNFILFGVLLWCRRWMVYADDKLQPNINWALHTIVWSHSKLPVTPRFPSFTCSPCYALAAGLCWMPQCADELGEAILFSCCLNVLFHSEVHAD